MPAKLILIEWRCPKCEKVESQPRMASSVLHLCKKTGSIVQMEVLHEQQEGNENAVP